LFWKDSLWKRHANYLLLISSGKLLNMIGSAEWRAVADHERQQMGVSFGEDGWNLDF
jgi:hypothetical protein